MDTGEIKKTIGTLTPTEKIILMLFCEGNKQKEMAKKLGVSFKAIEFHFSNIYGKLGLETELLPGKRKERWNIIREDYCPALADTIQTQPEETEVRVVLDELENSLVIRPSSELQNPRPNYKTLAIVRRDFDEIERYAGDSDGGSGGGSDDRNGGIGCGRMLLYMLIGVILTLGVLVGFWVLNQIFNWIPLAQATQITPTFRLLSQAKR